MSVKQQSHNPGSNSIQWQAYHVPSSSKDRAVVQISYEAPTGMYLLPSSLRSSRHSLTKVAMQRETRRQEDKKTIRSLTYAEHCGALHHHLYRGLDCTQRHILTPVLFFFPVEKSQPRTPRSPYITRNPPRLAFPDTYSAVLDLLLQ